MVMIKLKFYSFFVLLGGLSYWLTDIAIHFILKSASAAWIISLTVVVPIVVLLTYFYVRKKLDLKYTVSLPLFMLVGIWFLGPLGMGIGAIPTGGTFFESLNLKMLLSVWAVFPLSTWVMSAYSGSLGGLLLTTIMLFILTIIEGIKSA